MRPAVTCHEHDPHDRDHQTHRGPTEPHNVPLEPFDEVLHPSIGVPLNPPAAFDACTALSGTKARITTPTSAPTSNTSSPCTSCAGRVLRRAAARLTMSAITGPTSLCRVPKLTARTALPGFAPAAAQLENLPQPAAAGQPREHSPVRAAAGRTTPAPGACADV